MGTCRTELESLHQPFSIIHVAGVSFRSWALVSQAQ